MRAQKCVGHRAANDESIDLRHQILNREHLVTDFGAAENRKKRALRMTDARDEKLQFSCKQEAAHAQGAARFHRHWQRVHRCIGTMARPKRIVHIEVSESRKGGSKLRVALLFTL